MDSWHNFSWRRFFARRHPPQQGTIKLGFRTIYILPSRLGLGLAFLCFLILIGAINYQLSLAFFLTFLLAGAAQAAMLRTYAGLLNLDLRMGNPPPVFAGETLLFPLTLSSANQTERVDLRLHVAGNWLKIDVQGQTTLALPVPTHQRGWREMPRLLIECRQPTGWFRAWSYAIFARQGLVYPQPEANPPPLPGGGDSGNLGRLGGDTDFAGLRNYQIGDPPRLIAWRQLARSGQLLSKSFHDVGAGEILLDWAALSGLDDEARLSRLCAWILRAEQLELRYALELPSARILVNTGPEHCQRCLSALALYPGERP